MPPRPRPTARTIRATWPAPAPRRREGRRYWRPSPRANHQPWGRCSTCRPNGGCRSNGFSTASMATTRPSWPASTPTSPGARRNSCPPVRWWASWNRRRPSPVSAPWTTRTLVDVVGFLAIIAYQPTLEDAKFRRVASGIAQPHAVPVTADEALSGRREGEFVSLDGEMVGRAQASGGLELMIRSGGILVPALLPKQLADRDPSAWKEGSILRVSGICLGTAGPDIWALREGQIQPGAVHILLRSMDDIQLLQAPSWWTPEHTWKSFAAICAMILGAFAWIVILRHSVKQRTHALRASQDQLRHLSKHDALTGLANRILLNDRIHTALKRAKQSRSEER